MPKLQPVSPELHKDKQFASVTDYSFARADALAPLVMHELPKVMMLLPTVFIKSGDTYSLMVVQSLVPEKNILVDDKGKWIGRYKPHTYQAYPFYAFKNEAGDYVLFVDEESGLVSDADGTGTPFFSDDNSPTDAVMQKLNFLREYHSKLEKTGEIITLLDSKELIKPLQLKAQHEDEIVKNMEGLYCVDEQTLNELPESDLVELRDNGALVGAYCQMLSMLHFRQLFIIGQGELSMEAAKELDFDNLGDSDTLRFDNI